VEIREGAPNSDPFTAVFLPEFTSPAMVSLRRPSLTPEFLHLLHRSSLAITIHNSVNHISS